MMKTFTHKFTLHPAACEEVIALSAPLRGQAFRLMEKLEADGNLARHNHKLIGAGLYQLLIDDGTAAAGLYYYKNESDFLLLYAVSGKRKRTPAEAIQLARQRLENSMKPVNLSKIKKSMLNTEEALKAYAEADQELAVLEALHAMREHANLSKTELAARLNIKLPSLLGLERNPLGASMKTLTKYASACGASIELTIKYK